MMAFVDEGDKKRTGLSSAMSVAEMAKLRGSLEVLGFDRGIQSNMHTNDLQGLKEADIKQWRRMRRGRWSLRGELFPRCCHGHSGVTARDIRLLMLKVLGTCLPV